MTPCCNAVQENSHESIAASKSTGISVFEVLTHLTPSVYVDLLKETFSIIDLVFYAIAVYEGLRFSIARVTMADLK